MCVTILGQLWKQSNLQQDTTRHDKPKGPVISTQFIVDKV